MAAWAITQTKGNANVLLLTSNNYNNSKPVADGMMDEFKADCPSCKITTANVDGPDWPTKIQPTVQTAIARDPKLNYVLPVFDSMLVYVVPGVTTAGAVGRVKAASFNGTPAVLDLIRTSNVVTMDVGEDPSYIAAAALDQTLRVMGNLPPSPDEHLVLRVFNSSNIGEAGNPAQLGQGYGSAGLSGYRKLWGLQ
jgi:ribose transport system substrate-binding protein